MDVTLVRYTPDPDQLCGEAAALCTAYRGDPLKALKGAMASGHESVAEHASFTFRVENVSRVLLAQLTRHRLASFSVESQRYAGLNGNLLMLPTTVYDKLDEEGRKLISSTQDLYTSLVERGVPEEDARFVLPQGTSTRLMLTMNARELRHFFSLRCCNRAQWEIRELADRMLVLCKAAAPALFADAGAGCVRGHCPEGKRSCGRPRKMENEHG